MVVVLWAVVRFELTRWAYWPDMLIHATHIVLLSLLRAAYPQQHNHQYNICMGYVSWCGECNRLLRKTQILSDLFV